MNLEWIEPSLLIFENQGNFFEADTLQLGDFSVEVKEVEMAGEILMVSLTVDILPQLIHHPLVAKASEGLL